LLVKQLVPQAKTIGILLNQSEINAVVTSKLLAHHLRSEGFTVIQQAVIQESDIVLTAERLLSQVDALVTPIDNSVAATISLIARKATALKKPLIVSDNTLVRHGALAAAGIEYAVAGSKAAELACTVLVNGKTPAEIGFIQTPVEQFCINQTIAHNIGVAISPRLVAQSTLVKGFSCLQC